MDQRADTSVFRRLESEVRGYCRRFDTVFASASGSIMRDVQDREYLDFLAGCGALNYGHNDPDMAAALIEHIARDGITTALDLFTVAKRAFLERFDQLILAPRGLDHRVQFTGPSGTNAVEAALKLARKVTGRHNVVAFTNGYHGVSLGALATTGSKFHRMGMPLSGVFRAPFDGYFGPQVDTVEYLERLLADPSSGLEAPAAVLLETVQGEGGLNVASADWVGRIAELARRHGALLVVDDVQAGCGRTGSFFSFEGMNVVPDLVVMSKSISGFGLPMAIVLIRPQHDAWRPAEHNGTFRGNTHAFITARVALEKYWSSPAFGKSIAASGELVAARLQDIARIVPGACVKGRGMMRGLSVGSGELADRIARKCFESGLIVETSGPYDEVIKILPPLTTPAELLDRGLAILERATAQVMAREDRSRAATFRARSPRAAGPRPGTSPDGVPAADAPVADKCFRRPSH